MKASRAREVVYFTFIPIQVQEGTMYFFLAVDDYSKFIFTIGTSLHIDDEIYLQNIQALLNHKDFKKGTGSFVLVIPFGDELSNDIAKLIAPHGKLIVSEELVNQNALPYIAEALRMRKK